MKKVVTLRTILLNLGVILGAVVAVAFASHFALRIITRHNVHCTVPQFKGVSLNEAKMIAQMSELKIVINDSLHVTTCPGGTVLDQLPAAGVEVKPGRTVYIVINAFGQRMVEVPYVAGRSLRQAKNMLEVAGLEIARLDYVEDMATNYVLGQSFEGRDIDEQSSIKAPVGSGVTLTVGVSERTPQTITPNIIGLSFKQAKNRLWESGINVGRIDVDKGINLLENPTARVYIQSIGANQMVEWGSSISITLTIDEVKITSAVDEANKADLEYAESLLNDTSEPEPVEESSPSSEQTTPDDEFF